MARGIGKGSGLAAGSDRQVPCNIIGFRYEVWKFWIRLKINLGFAMSTGNIPRINLPIVTFIDKMHVLFLTIDF